MKSKGDIISAHSAWYMDEAYQTSAEWEEEIKKEGEDGTYEETRKYTLFSTLYFFRIHLFKFSNGGLLKTMLESGEEEEAKRFTVRFMAAKTGYPKTTSFWKDYLGPYQWDNIKMADSSYGHRTYSTSPLFLSTSSSEAPSADIFGFIGRTFETEKEAIAFISELKKAIEKDHAHYFPIEEEIIEEVKEIHSKYAWNN